MIEIILVLLGLAAASALFAVGVVWLVTEITK